MIRIVESKFIKSAVKPKDYLYNGYFDIAFCGKSNVGKSSLLNSLTNRKKIAKTSSTPGKTKLINFFRIRYLRDDKNEGYINFVDLPGYGYAKVSKTEREKWKIMLSDYFRQRVEIKGMILLIDIRHGFDKKDEILLEMASEHHIPLIIVATKSDKIAKTKIPSRLKKIKESNTQREIIPVSSLKKNGLDSLLSQIEKMIFGDK